MTLSAMFATTFLADVDDAVQSGRTPRPGLRTRTRGYTPVLASLLARQSMRDKADDTPGLVFADLLIRVAAGTLGSETALRIALQEHRYLYKRQHEQSLLFELLYGALELTAYEEARGERLLRAATAEEVLLLVAGLGRGLSERREEGAANIAHFLLHAAVFLCADSTVPWETFTVRVQERLAAWGEEPTVDLMIAYAARNLELAIEGAPEDDGAYDVIRAGRTALREGTARAVVHAGWLTTFGWRTADRLLPILCGRERRPFHQTAMALVMQAPPTQRAARAVELGLVDEGGVPMVLGARDPDLLRLRFPGGSSIGRSCVLYEGAGVRIAVDMGGDPYGRLPAWTPALEDLDAVLITHAHQDHIAALPHLYGELGYTGVWYATKTTIACAVLALKDGAKLQAERRERTVADAQIVDRVISCARAMDMGVPFDIGPVRITALEAGHVRGSAQYLIEAPRGDAMHRTLVSGDINPGVTLSVEPLRYPQVPIDVLVAEGTNALRDEVILDGAAAGAALRAAIHDEPRRPVLLPVMSLGRAQEVVAALAETPWRVGVFGLAARMTGASGLPVPSNVTLETQSAGRIEADEYDVLIASAGGLQGGPSRIFWAERGWEPPVILTGHLFVGTPAHALASRYPLVRFSGHASAKQWAKYVAKVGAGVTFLVHYPGESAAARAAGLVVPRSDRAYAL
jgi:ribonuclease BN (tRNA processing enzyme)